MNILEKLIKNRTPQLRTYNSMFESLDILEKEEYHTKIIGWFLHPNGPLPENVFLKKIFYYCFPDDSFPGTPITLSAEFAKGNKRVDIYIEWEKHILCIENKIKSGEGKNQILGYLKQYTKPEKKFKLIYLTKNKSRPKSVPDLNEIELMGYYELFELLNSCNGIIKNHSILEDYIIALEELTNRRRIMERPKCLDETKLIINNWEIIDKHIDNAISDTEDIIKWINTTIADKLKNDFGLECYKHSGDYAFMYRRSEWKVGDVEFGIGFGVEKKVGKRVLPEHEIVLGIRVNGNKPISRKIKDIFQPKFPLKNQSSFRDNNGWWSYYETYNFEKGDIIDNWTTSIIEIIHNIAEEFVPVFDENLKEIRS